VSLIAGALRFDAAGNILTINENVVSSIYFNGGTPTGPEERLVTDESKPLPPGPTLLLKFDLYADAFVRGYWSVAISRGVNIFDGGQHKFVFTLKTGGTNPNGVNFADTAALAAQPGVAWFDNEGNLGHIKTAANADLTNVELAQLINDGSMIIATAVVDGGDGHPVFNIVEILPP
jgi:hypothetical protein